ncbi:MAG: type II toxin-antitoxin system Phd/YefM family antitoxin [Rhodospirillaceae bacterium]|nr:type II toxin-antitoxin system Phd/YefM family antitoxin [Rhodospirillaceae bacterium]
MGPRMKTIAATEFKARCLRVIGQMCEDREPVTITKHGQPLAVLSPYVPADGTDSIIGAMQGSVLGYDDPFLPAADPDDWDANR